MTEALARADPVWTDDAIRHHATRLYRSALGLTRNATDAEDLVQETFTKAFAASGRFQPDNLGGWLYRIMFNTFADGYRRRRPEPLLAADLASREADLAWSRESADGRSAGRPRSTSFRAPSMPRYWRRSGRCHPDTGSWCTWPT